MLDISIRAYVDLETWNQKYMVIGSFLICSLNGTKQETANTQLVTHTQSEVLCRDHQTDFHLYFYRFIEDEN